MGWEGRNSIPFYSYINWGRSVVLRINAVAKAVRRRFVKRFICYNVSPICEDKGMPRDLARLLGRIFLKQSFRPLSLDQLSDHHVSVITPTIWIVSVVWRFRFLKTTWTFRIHKYYIQLLPTVFLQWSDFWFWLFPCNVRIIWQSVSSYQDVNFQVFIRGI